MQSERTVTFVEPRWRSERAEVARSVAVQGEEFANLTRRPIRGV
jgi:hypothetical protein